MREGQVVPEPSAERCGFRSEACVLGEEVAHCHARIVPGVHRGLRSTSWGPRSDLLHPRAEARDSGPSSRGWCRRQRDRRQGGDDVDEGDARRRASYTFEEGVGIIQERGVVADAEPGRIVADVGRRRGVDGERDRDGTRRHGRAGVWVHDPHERVVVRPAVGVREDVVPGRRAVVDVAVLDGEEPVDGALLGLLAADLDGDDASAMRREGKPPQNFELGALGVDREEVDDGRDRVRPEQRLEPRRRDARHRRRGPLTSGGSEPVALDVDDAGDARRDPRVDEVDEAIVGVEGRDGRDGARAVPERGPHARPQRLDAESAPAEVDVERRRVGEVEAVVRADVDVDATSLAREPVECDDILSRLGLRAARRVARVCHSRRGGRFVGR
mmetsp:Transcript_5574/g.23159  ORF Transcript_5574/g.23159 Transcript_5574/m.23159 type:complete len:386 (-) Transcript_5574:537-1694(-)